MASTAKNGAADVIHADFASFLKLVNKGNTEAEASLALEKITAAVKDTGRAGSFSIKVSITPAGKGEVTQVFVDAEVSTKEPKKDRKHTIFFTTNNNTLVRNNPEQNEMPVITEHFEGKAK